MLSDEDVRAQQQLVSDLTLKVLLPHIDKRVRALNQQVRKPAHLWLYFVLLWRGPSLAH
jgi:hypothetical protein